MNSTAMQWKGSIHSAIRAFFRRAELTISAKVAVAAALSFLAGQALGIFIEHPESIVSSLWCVMASVVVMQSRLGGTYKAVWTRFLGILIGSVAGGFFINFFGEGALSILTGVFITVTLCSLLGLNDSIRIAGLSTALIIILAGARPEVNPWSFTFFRFLDSCVGMIVSLSVAYFLWPEKAIENMRTTTIRILGLLVKYYRKVTSLDKNDESHEKGLKALSRDIVELIDENRTYCDESQMELFDRDNVHEHWKAFAVQLQDLFEKMETLGVVKHESVGMIIDDPLAKAINKTVEDTDTVLQNMEKALALSPLQLQSHSLEESLQSLYDELLRFRQTRTTRKFGLEEVESFFVYFYSLKAIGDEVLKMESTAEKM